MAEMLILVLAVSLLTVAIVATLFVSGTIDRFQIWGTTGWWLSKTLGAIAAWWTALVGPDWVNNVMHFLFAIWAFLAGSITILALTSASYFLTKARRKHRDEIRSIYEPQSQSGPTVTI
jgi:hypothetical protein